MRSSRSILAFSRGGLLVAFAMQWALVQANAAANAAEEIDVPKLVPPYSELPPTFWERNGFTVFLSILIGLLVVGVLLWFWRRNKPAVVLPPEVQARLALEALLSKVEDGAVLSQVSHILRRYLRATFDLPLEELTTTEFCGALSRQEHVGAEMAAQISDFLRRCDERKFSASPAASLNAVTVALELVALGETRRAQLSGSAGILPASSSTPRGEIRRPEAGASRE